MEPNEIETTLIIAAGLCVTVALTDLVITLIKRAKAKKRIEALPHNATAITRKPLYEEEPQVQEEEHTVEFQDDTAGDLSPAPSP